MLGTMRRAGERNSVCWHASLTHFRTPLGAVGAFKSLALIFISSFFSYIAFLLHLLLPVGLGEVIALRASHTLSRGKHRLRLRFDTCIACWNDSCFLLYTNNFEMEVMQVRFCSPAHQFWLLPWVQTSCSFWRGHRLSTRLWAAGKKEKEEVSEEGVKDGDESGGGQNRTWG